MGEIISKHSGSSLFLAAVALMFVGVAGNPLLLGCSILLLAAAEYQRNKLIGAIGALAGVLFLLFVFGYVVGKDLALRENSQTAAEPPVHAP